MMVSGLGLISPIKLPMKTKFQMQESNSFYSPPRTQFSPRIHVITVTSINQTYLETQSLEQEPNLPQFLNHIIVGKLKIFLEFTLVTDTFNSSSNQGPHIISNECYVVILTTAIKVKEKAHIHCCRSAQQDTFIEDTLLNFIQ